MAKLLDPTIGSSRSWNNLAPATVESQRLQQAIELFEHAITLRREERKPWLAKATKGDQELTQYVLRMISNDEQAQLAIQTAAGFQQFDVTKNWIGQYFGPYRLTKLLGEGGMSLVFLAERTDGVYQGNVALKLIKNPTASEEIKRRFDLERQVLADLRHPNIATLLDAGSAQDMEYVVLEYIDGEPFYDHQRNLEIDQLLALFRDVCSAVEYAHQSLIVHRDIKPGNILVDHRGQVKLLDFGIAKDLALASVEATAWTMTPAYASPEQVSGHPITIATDIYSLGVLLYEALTSSRPHELANLAPGEAVTRLLEHQPVPPSQISERMQRLNTQAQRDLDAIVTRAMEKDPLQRYRTVSALIDDLDAYVEGRPVAARSGNRWYATRKFVQRNKIPVLAAVIATFSLVGALIVALNQVQLASEQLARSEAVSRYLQDILTAPDPTWNQSIRGGPGVTVADTLESAEAQLDNDLLDQPLVRIELYETIGTAQMWLDNKEAALSARRKALELRRTTSSNDPLQESIGLMRLAEVHDDWGESDLSLPLYLEAINKFELSRSAPSEYSSLLYNDTGIAFFNDKQYQRSLYFQRKALEMSRELSNPQAVTHAAVFHINFGRAMLESGDVEGALSQLETTKKRYEEDNRIPSIYMNRLFHTLGVASILSEDFDAAVEHFDQALQRSLADNHVESAALAIKEQGWQIYAGLLAGGEQRVVAQSRIKELAQSLESLGGQYEAMRWVYHFVLGVAALQNRSNTKAIHNLELAAALSQNPHLRVTGLERGLLNRHLAEAQASANN